MKRYVFNILEDFDLEEAWQILENQGCQLLFSIEEEGDQKIFGTLPTEISKNALMKKNPFISKIEIDNLLEIDWEAQWQQHAVGYADGFLHVDVKDYFPPSMQNQWPMQLKLAAGPGFGDLSHPTTRIVMKLMGDYVQAKNVIDIGCGSGILSLAALTMGAKAVTGVDIDPEALKHALENSRLNGMEEAIKFCLPVQYQLTHKPQVALMNMIQSEQVQAWESLAKVHRHVKHVITSGVLCEGEDEYLQQCHQWGWKVQKRLEEDGWVGFVWGCCL